MNSRVEERISFDLAKDPVTKLILKKWGYRGIFLFFIFPLILICLSSLYEGSFLVIKQAIELGFTQIPMSKDYGFWFLFIQAFVTALLVKNLFKNAPYCFDRLWERNIFSEEVEHTDYQKFFSTYEKKANSKTTYLLGLLFITFLIIPLTYSSLYQNWYQSGVIGFNDIRYFFLTWLITITIFLFYAFLIGVLVWKIYILVKSMREVCRPDNFTLRLQPLNPDKTAGLQPLGLLGFRMSSIFLSFGIFVVVVFSTGFIRPQLRHSFFLWGMYAFIIYVTLSTFLFFYPLVSAHNIMKEQKDRLLDRLSSELGVTYSEFYGELAQKGTRVEKDRVGQLLSIREIYLEAGKMPVWPFDTETLLKFLGTVLVPVIMIITEMIVSNFLL